MRHSVAFNPTWAIGGHLLSPTHQARTSRPVLTKVTIVRRTGSCQPVMMAANPHSPWAWLVPPSPHHAEYAGSREWANRTLADLIFERTSDEPDAIVMIAGSKRMSRADLLQDAEALAVSLSDLELKPGDVVSFQTPNWIEAATINLAAALSGIVINPIVPIYRDAEVGMMLADSRARALFVCTSFRNFDYIAMIDRIRPALPDLKHTIAVRGDGDLTFEKLLEAGRGRQFVRPQVDPQSVKLLLYTSGTTGKPKGVLHSHDTLFRVVRKSSQFWHLNDGDAVIMPSPVTHISGYGNGLEMPIVAGTRTILMERWDALDALELIDEHRVVGTVAATPFLVELASAARAADKPLPSLRMFACGGAAVSANIILEANGAFANCQAFRVYGSSETPLVTLGYPNRNDEPLAAATDGAVVDYRVRIVDENQKELPAGEDGEILVRGPSMFMGYADRDQTRDSITEDGFFRTGDIGRITPEGSLIVTGRKKDLIIRGGENISAREIEDILHTHPSVREAAVVAMPHERLGEGICAYVILETGAAVTAADLAIHVQSSGLARQKTPERFEFVDVLPLTPSGKIRKDQLRKDVADKMRVHPA